MTGACRDVTRLKAAEEALREETRTLELLNATGTLLAGQARARARAAGGHRRGDGRQRRRVRRLLLQRHQRRRRRAASSTRCRARRARPSSVSASRARPPSSGRRSAALRRSASTTCSPIRATRRWARTAACRRATCRCAATSRSPVRSRSGEVLGGLFFGHPEPASSPSAPSGSSSASPRQAGVAIDNARLYEEAQRAAGGAQGAARQRARRARRGRARERHQGRVPRHALARAAHAAERHPRLGAAAAHRRPHAPTELRARPRDDRAQRARPGAAHRRPARHEPHHLRQAPARRAAAGPAVVHRGGGRDGDAGGRRQGHPAASASSIPRPDRCRGDPGRLQQVVWNLLSNAIKFTPAAARVQVVLERVDSHVEIASPTPARASSREFLPHVFERFRQADASTTRRHGGLGLGLSIVKNLVELHGGTVGVTSAGEGTGTTFTVHLPLTRRARRGDRPTGRGCIRGAPPRPAACRRGLPASRCSSVDDEPDARELVERVLEDCGGGRARRRRRRTRRLALVERSVPTCWSATSACPTRTATSCSAGCARSGPSAAATSRHRADRLRAPRGPDARAARRLPRPRRQAGRGLRAGGHRGQRRRPRPCLHWVAADAVWRPRRHRHSVQAGTDPVTAGACPPPSFPSSNINDPYGSRDTGLDETIESSFPASDPPSSIPDPTSDRATSYASDSESSIEGRFARRIEQQAARLPSDPFLWAAVGSLGVSAALHAAGKKNASLFVGLWAPAFLLLGIYDKLARRWAPTATIGLRTTPRREPSRWCTHT